jgi:hypothetical protein
LFAHQAFSEGIKNIIQTVIEQFSKDAGFEVLTVVYTVYN